MFRLGEVTLVILLTAELGGVHGISSKCGNSKVCERYDCTDQIQPSEHGEGCEIRSPNKVKECDVKPKWALDKASLKVNLKMFYRSNGLPGRVAFNLTLQGIYSNSRSCQRIA
ncbi:uncharacterized protein LOC122252666 [Penaeus japonicus]|uniref:uncharacterized protein LOC122252666 n=1 Tax=Penaeus japonicus TaxID=27405 RepID=UPI001C70D00F|nr:uncharacterized protein LOC122252666 [Penaeus japonicus]